MKKKDEQKELVTKKMNELNIPEDLLDCISEYKDGKMRTYNVEENPTAREYKNAVEFMLESYVYHICNNVTDIGEAWYLLLVSPTKADGARAYAYFPDTPTQSREMEVKITIKDNGIIVEEKENG